MSLARLAPLAVIAALFILPSGALAQSGTPGTDNAADGVYGGGDVLGPPETTRNDPPGGGGVAPPDNPGGGDSRSVPFSASNVNRDDGDDDTSSVPFTGFYVVLPVAAALVLLVVGVGLRRSARDRPRSG